jgi:hypothetical protein
MLFEEPRTRIGARFPILFRSKNLVDHIVENDRPQPGGPAIAGGAGPIIVEISDTKFVLASTRQFGEAASTDSEFEGANN